MAACWSSVIRTSRRGAFGRFSPASGLLLMIRSRAAQFMARLMAMIAPRRLEVPQCASLSSHLVTWHGRSSRIVSPLQDVQNLAGKWP